VGLFGCSSEEAVRRERGRIVSFAYHAALCHDVGKLPEIDTIFMYGRKLLDLEFEVIKEHPNLGAHLLRKHLDTREYADIARGHHRWYDNSRGYPEDFDTRTSDYKPLIDLVACMDCMDAATDSVGRSYKQGKSLDDFLEELRDGEGTRYAPWLFEVMSHPKVRRDLEFLLDKGRMQVYRDTYLLLRSVNEQGKLVAGA
jgi:HD-GYP domain-containing protein (c-di-GMP phosphodiesterase class II)